MPFPLRDIRKKSSQHVRACAAGDGAICSKNRKIVPYHGANPNTRNGARLRSPSPIMAPDFTNQLEEKRTREEEFCGVCENDEELTIPDMAGDLATKIDLALSKLDKPETIEKSLDSLITSISSIEETVGRLDKEVVSLKNKTSETETRVKELEEGTRFNEVELSDIYSKARP